MKIGHCECTMKISSKSKWEETFSKARTNLNQQCCAFTYSVMGYDDDRLRLLAMCM